MAVGNLSKLGNYESPPQAILNLEKRSYIFLQANVFNFVDLISRAQVDSFKEIRGDQIMFIMALNIGIFIMIGVMLVESIIVAYSIEKIPNIIQNELALFLVIPDACVNKQLGKIRGFDFFLNQKFKFTTENDQDDDRCDRIQKTKQDLTSTMYEGNSRSQLDSETRSGINNPGNSMIDRSKFFQKDSFDQTGLEMLGELRQRVSDKEDWSKNRRLNQFRI